MVVTAPVECFRWGNLLRLLVLPISLSFLLWWMAVRVYQANPTIEQNLVFAFYMAMAASVVAKQGYHEPDITSTYSQFMALAVHVPISVFMAASFLHLAAILPRQQPSTWLIQTAPFWYLVLPLVLVVIGTIQFRLNPGWTPVVGDLARFFGWGIILFRYGGPLILFLRCVSVMRAPVSRQANSQARLLAISMIPAFLLVPLEVVWQNPRLALWLPISQPAMFFLVALGFIGFSYAILRYQLFPGRLRQLTTLLVVATALSVAILASRLLSLDAELGFVALLLLLIGISYLWTIPNPLQRLLQRLASPGTIEREIIEKFSFDVQETAEAEWLPQVIVQSMTKYLELRFAALWLVHQPGILTLETFTEEAPAERLPDELPLDVGWSEQLARLGTGPLAAADCHLVLPLVVGGRRLGLIGLGPRWTEELFDETDLSALAVMAYQAALSLNSARQIDELRQVPLRVEQAQWRERERVAQDLHDSTQARLYYLGLTLARIQARVDTNPDEASALLERCSDSVAKAAHELRVILSDLMPVTATQYLLGEMLQAYIDQVQQHREAPLIHLSLDERVENLLSAQDKVDLLSVCQQAVHNALQHAAAQTIRIGLLCQPEEKRIHLVIDDDGQGFDYQATADLLRQGHFGLYIMETRLTRLGGELIIHSQPGNGTRLSSYLPISQASGVA
jgi:signal transduction histidine kinase